MTDLSPELVQSLRKAAEHLDSCAGSSAEEARRFFQNVITRVIESLRRSTHRRRGTT